VAPDAAAIAELSAAVDAVTAGGVSVRGLYDVTGMRGEADLMIWLHTTPGELDDPAVLQKALRALRRTGVLQAYTAVWTAMGVHREAEFNKRHVPGYLRGESARGWLCLYPFVRSYEWYLLPEEERAACSPSTAARARASRRSSPTPSRPSDSATTSGCCRWRATTRSTSST
jgi:chlorite dismutase